MRTVRPEATRVESASRDLAGMARWSYDRGMHTRYGAEEVREDLATLDKLARLRDSGG